MKSRLVLFTTCLLVFSLLFCRSTFAAPVNIIGPPGSRSFGYSVTVLPNGNVVVIDPFFDGPGPVANVGAIHLYDGLTLALISTTRGSTANDYVGESGVVVLSDGNFVVKSGYWSNNGAPNAGAVTWCHQTAGCNGSTVGPGNSLVGFTAHDNVGGTSTVGGVTPLNNGFYVVSSPSWDNPASGRVDVGAVTFGFANGRVGVVTQDNSLTGSTHNDYVGLRPITVLSNGNYVVRSPFWDDPMFSNVNAGAVTWGSGTTDVFGMPVSNTNSLVGRSSDDLIGHGGVTPLTNGNYVVSSPAWDNIATIVANVGAATWASGTGATTGYVLHTNSLIGSTVEDSVTGNDYNSAFRGVIALSNGNYVVGSPIWDNPSTMVANVGAATWCSGTGPTAGPVTTGNSLVGSIADDRVTGAINPYYGLAALTNGNYVVGSPKWDNPAPATEDVGAVTWCNGSSGRIGTVSSGNSLIGGTAGDHVGSYFGVGDRGITALSNGNYVVASGGWSNTSPVASHVGAVTWGNGLVGTIGIVNSGNSLFGSTPLDLAGFNVTPLINGNYVVSMLSWDNTSPAIVDAGAVTWCNGLGGTVGVVSSGNSLVGGTASDQVGFIVVALTNGNYAVRSHFWDNPSPATENAGAVTWCSGTTGRIGLINASNSLIGGSADDYVGSLDSTALAKGRYIVSSRRWNNPVGPIVDAGAVTVLSGHGGPTGLINSRNSILGTEKNLFGMPYSYDNKRNRLFVGRPDSNIVTTRTFRNSFDFDGDGADDISVFRPSTGYWHLSQSSAGYSPVQFGTNGDQITPGDFDGDLKTDIAVFRPSIGYWYILNSSDGSFRATQFGQTGDIPATGDYDGDGRADTAVFRPSAGIFYVMYSSNNSFQFKQWGQSGDRPVMGDYDSDGKTDFAVFRPAIGTFYILRSSDQVVIGKQFGQNGDKPIAGDFDGDGETDIAVYRPGNGGWFYLRSSTNIFNGIGWGAPGDLPVGGDYDGDGKWDVAVFRPSNGVSYILQSSNGVFRAEQFGLNGDVPVGSAYSQ